MLVKKETQIQILVWHVSGEAQFQLCKIEPKIMESNCISAEEETL